MRAHAIPVVSNLLLQSDVLPKKGFPIVFHGVKGRELRARHSPSYLNIHEASVVRDYCLRLLGDNERKICEYRISLMLYFFPLIPFVDAEEIGVIAPYKAQVRAIRELLRPAGLKEVSVGSVEQFQGQVCATRWFLGRQSMLIHVRLNAGTEGDYFRHDPKQLRGGEAEGNGFLTKPPTNERYALFFEHS